MHKPPHHALPRIDEALSRIPLFAGLGPKELGLIGQAARVRQYNRGDMICRADDPSSLLFYLLEGSVQLSTETPEGQTIGLTTLMAPDWFGAYSLLDDAHQPTTVVAISTCQAVLLPRTTLLTSIKKDPEVALALLRAAQKQIQDIVAHLSQIHGAKALARIARVLENLATRHGEATTDGTRINIRLTHNTLAELAGLTRETTTSIVAIIKSDGAVAVDAEHRYTIRPKRLQKYLEGVGTE